MWQFRHSSLKREHTRPPVKVVNLPLGYCIASSRRGRFPMWSSRVVFENDACPVGDELLGTLYRASEHGLAELVETVSSDVRAMLALFCYRRAHLHSMSLAIEANYSTRDLSLQ